MLFQQGHEDCLCNLTFDLSSCDICVNVTNDVKQIGYDVQNAGIFIKAQSNGFYLGLQSETLMIGEPAYIDLSQNITLPVEIPTLEYNDIDEIVTEAGDE